MPRRPRFSPLVLASLGFLVSTSASAGVRYDETFFKDHYSRIASRQETFANGTPLLPVDTTRSPNRFATAIVTQTDPVKITYDQELARIQITGESIRPLYLEVRNFRSVSLSWATDRILVIERDIGHEAAMEEVIDIVDRRWLSQKALLYTAE
jgi:hypothetical protein